MFNVDRVTGSLARNLQSPYLSSMVASAQGLIDGIASIKNQMSDRAKALQKFEANQYVSNLLGESTIDNYRDKLLEVNKVSPYASQELLRQIDNATQRFQRDEDIEHRNEREKVLDEQNLKNYYLNAFKTLYDLQYKYDALRQEKEEGILNRENASNNASISAKALADKALVEEEKIKQKLLNEFDPNIALENTKKRQGHILDIFTPDSTYFDQVNYAYELIRENSKLATPDQVGLLLSFIKNGNPNKAIELVENLIEESNKKTKK